ncbi:MAG: rRNA maturation RNase YbeY, partial [Vicinamibacterales bacterium]|nr:rRNA maturation RNase YbeY [Vicinamibacterales bacterium]
WGRMPRREAELRRAAARPPRLVVEVVPFRGIPARGLGAWLSRSGPGRAAGGVCVALVSDARVRALNRQYRGADRNTDVLSFPSGPGVEPALGDIVIATGVARRQAAAAGHALSTELKVLALHGLLHLLGYDHETDGGEMARLEQRLRRRHGLPAGLIERTIR